MKFVAALAALLVAGSAVVSGQTMPTPYNCATGPTQIQITNFTLAPYPMCIGQNVCATGTGTLSTPVVQGASLSIIGKYLNRVVYTDSHNLCDLMNAQGHPCPIPTTMTSITSCVLVKTTAPANIPVVLTVSATNGDGNLLFCQGANGVIAKNCPP
ncbi:hypothetical protein DFQ26_004123 [Actinomortierella ambigua]|nr:hypothetical protein DFQ26_004123 [Actinomortierella ambigua]